ncbi:TetR/AcrR family transcriptional regulator [Dokdonella sp.]|uniref:TetR/AcrR family transcriptional regulator n=1 Tax=Dokdonella sp. TaxID=2291710 RepID=UPI00262CD070|nr:TetR/AcrR family transcriptional regulator [Dokdonella sp.]
MAPRSSSRERILEAAEKVAIEVGVGHLTLEAVATKAGISKGGLLYHFGTKEALLKGMIDRHMDEEAQRIAETHAELGGTPGTYLRAFVDSMMQANGKDLHTPAVSRSFLAAAANSPGLLERPRTVFAEHFERLRASGGHFPLAAIVSLALDGLYFGDIFEFSTLTPTEREQLTAELLKLADRASLPPA